MLTYIKSKLDKLEPIESLILIGVSGFITLIIGSVLVGRIINMIIEIVTVIAG